MPLTITPAQADVLADAYTPVPDKTEDEVLTEISNQIRAHATAGNRSARVTVPLISNAIASDVKNTLEATGYTVDFFYNGTTKGATYKVSGWNIT